MGGKNVFLLQTKAVSTLCSKYHVSLGGGTNCVGSDKFPPLSNGILKTHVLLWLFRNTVFYNLADPSEKLHALQENEQL